MTRFLYPSILACTTAISVGVVLLTLPSFTGFGVGLLTCLSVAVFFYNLVWQYGRIDSITGGTARVSQLYALSFVILLYGYLGVAGSFLLNQPLLSLLGGFSIVGGILVAQSSNALLLNQIVKGRRWKL